MRVVPERIDEAAQRTARERLPIDGVLVDEALLDEPDGLIEQLRVDERLVVLRFCLARPGGQRHHGDEDGCGERDEEPPGPWCGSIWHGRRPSHRVCGASWMTPARTARIRSDRVPADRSWMDAGERSWMTAPRGREFVDRWLARHGGSALSSSQPGGANETGFRRGWSASHSGSRSEGPSGSSHVRRRTKAKTDAAGPGVRGRVSREMARGTRRVPREPRSKTGTTEDPTMIDDRLPLVRRRAGCAARRRGPRGCALPLPGVRHDRPVDGRAGGGPRARGLTPPPRRGSVPRPVPRP